MPGEMKPTQPQAEMEYRLIPLDLIDDPERPMRTELTTESVKELVLSIKQVGIIEPLVVKPVGKRYEVIAGHRRLVASTIANLAQVPCSIISANKEQTELLKIHENLYRENIKPSDEAEHFKYMIEEHKLSPVRIAKLIGRSETYVSDRLAIFNFTPELRRYLDSGKISFSVAREFNRMTDLSKMSEYLGYAVRNGITAKLARQWVIDHNKSLEPQPETTTMVPYTDNGSGVVEHSSICVFCQKAILLREANVVYIHDHCLSEASVPVDDGNTDRQALTS